MMPEIFLADSTALPERYISEKEREVAQWVITNNKRAGAGTETLSDSCCTYLSVRTGKQIYGVVGIAASDKPLDTFETSILLSVLGESALAFENQKNLEEKEAAAVLAKNEQLLANLLRSISHDLHTPLTSISGNASNLLSTGDLFDAKTKEQMYTDIYDDAMWLINLVENLLSVSRLEEGRMNLHISTELIDEVVAEALRHINRKSAEYHLKVQNSEEYLLVQIDAKLIVQVIINLVDNAIKYTPPGSEIDIGWKQRGSYVYISVEDNGPGISDKDKPHIFDMFYSASNQIADSRRSMGLGLALCKSIVNAHGGEIMVTNHLPHGSIFTLCGAHKAYKNSYGYFSKEELQNMASDVIKQMFFSSGMYCFNYSNGSIEKIVGEDSFTISASVSFLTNGSFQDRCFIVTVEPRSSIEYVCQYYCME